MSYQKYTTDHIISMKTRKLGLDVVAYVDHYIKTPGASKEGYVKELYDVTLSQLIIKAGFNINTYPAGVDRSEQQRLEYSADRLTTHFLKRKLDRIKQPEQLAFKTGSEVLDPHHHLNSVYVKDHPDLLNLLPDFGAIYVALRSLAANPKREQELRDQQGILTDIQFLGRPPKGGFQARDGSQRLNATVGYVRGPDASDGFKEGFISQYAGQHGNVCRCCDMCGPETKDSWKDLERYLNHTIRHRAEIIRVHIGETHIPSHGQHNVEQLFRLLDQKRASGGITNQVIRLGHGTHMGFQSMKDAALHGYYVEACLSSNKETGIIGKRKEYPLGPMLLLDVKVMIGTDGGDLYYTDLKREYTHARKNINHFLSAINQGKHQVVTLPNGDVLLYKHVKELFKETPQAETWDDDKVIEFADLKLIEPICKQKINMHQLVDNMNEFKEKMFPGHSQRAALLEEQGDVEITPTKVVQDQEKPFLLGQGHKVLAIEKQPDGGFIVKGENAAKQPRILRVLANGMLRNFQGGEKIEGFVTRLIMDRIDEIFAHFKTPLPKPAPDPMSLAPVLRAVDLGSFALSSRHRPVTFRHRDFTQYKEFWDKETASTDMHAIASAISRDLIEQPYADNPTDMLTNDTQTAYHENHGTGHAIRQRELALHYLTMVQLFGASPHAEAASALTKEEIACMELAAYMYRSGRTNENPGLTDQTNKQRSAILFTSVAKQLGFNDDLVKSITTLMCSSMSVNAWKEGKIDLKGAEKGFSANEAVTPEQKAMVIMRILDLSHHTDLVRCWQDREPNTVRKPIADQIDYLIKDKSQTQHYMETMIDYAVELCKATGARVVIDGKPLVRLNRDQVIRVANNPTEAMQELAKLHPKELYQPQEKDRLAGQDRSAASAKHHIENKYAYQTLNAAKGRSHTFFAVDAVNFKGLKEAYKGLKGDYLKTRILNDFQNQIENTNSKAELEQLKKDLMKSEEYKVLKTGQGLFTLLTGIKTSSVRAFEEMCKDQENTMKDDAIKNKI